MATIAHRLTQANAVPMLRAVNLAASFDPNKIVPIVLFTTKAYALDTHQGAMGIFTEAIQNRMLRGEALLKAMVDRGEASIYLAPVQKVTRDRLDQVVEAYDRVIQHFSDKISILEANAQAWGFDKPEDIEILSDAQRRKDGVAALRDLIDTAGTNIRCFRLGDLYTAYLASETQNLWPAMVRALMAGNGQVETFWKSLKSLPDWGNITQKVVMPQAGTGTKTSVPSIAQARIG